MSIEESNMADAKVALANAANALSKIEGELYLKGLLLTRLRAHHKAGSPGSCKYNSEVTNYHRIEVERSDAKDRYMDSLSKLKLAEKELENL